MFPRSVIGLHHDTALKAPVSPELRPVACLALTQSRAICCRHPRISPWFDLQSCQLLLPAEAQPPLRPCIHNSEPIPVLLWRAPAHRPSFLSTFLRNQNKCWTMLPHSEIWLLEPSQAL